VGDLKLFSPFPLNVIRLITLAKFHQSSLGKKRKTREMIKRGQRETKHAKNEGEGGGERKREILFAYAR